MGSRRGPLSSAWPAAARAGTAAIAPWPGLAPAGGPVVTFAPGWRLSTPSVTTGSPAATPVRTAVSSPSVCATSTVRMSAVESGFTTQTYTPWGLRCKAAVGMITLRCRVSTRRRAFTNWFEKRP
jgi:hypothetical protein